MRRLILAIGFLTRLPVPAVAASAEEFAAAIRCYPLAGLAVGGMVAGAAWAGALLDPWVAALAGLAAWVAVTGALHLDGLGDLADALGAGHRDRARTIAVLGDPHVGGFGVVAIAMQSIAKLVLLHALAPDPWALPLVPAAARIGPIAWARWLPPIKPGLGESVAAAARTRDVAGWALLLAGACAIEPGLLATPILIAGVALWLQRRLGGVSGDAHGAGIEIVETGLLIALLVARRLG